jgi:regulator of sirC expression with transglutaminase-like and TPR domain
MKPAGDIALGDQLSESQRSALLNLLTDEDPDIYHTVREKILSYGPGAAAWLRPHLASRDSALRNRARELVTYFDRQQADDDFLAFCLNHGEAFGLEQGAWLLAKTHSPDINIDGYQALLDSYAADLRERLAAGLGARDTLHRVNDYLFQELGYAGNKENYYDPDNSYLNCVVDRRTGNPINLCLLYMLVTRRLQLPVTGIGLPGHFVCRFQSTAAELYIDAFNEGRLLTKADCVQYLVQGNFSVREDYLSPISPRRMLLRICSNLHQVYSHLERAEEVNRIQRYLVALAR